MYEMHEMHLRQQQQEYFWPTFLSDSVIQCCAALAEKGSQTQ